LEAAAKCGLEAVVKCGLEAVVKKSGGEEK
jgi:hypothetical protein